MRTLRFVGSLGLLTVIGLGAGFDRSLANPPFKGGINNVNNIDINFILSGIGMMGGAIGNQPGQNVGGQPNLPQVLPVPGAVPQNPFPNPIQQPGGQGKGKGNAQAGMQFGMQGKGKGNAQAGGGQGQGKGKGAQMAGAKGGKGGGPQGGGAGAQQQAAVNRAPNFLQNIGGNAQRPQLQPMMQNRGAFGPAQVGAGGAKGKLR